jgi:hypothetical protein
MKTIKYNGREYKLPFNVQLPEDPAKPFCPGANAPGRTDPYQIPISKKSLTPPPSI